MQEILTVTPDVTRRFQAIFDHVDRRWPMNESKIPGLKDLSPDDQACLRVSKILAEVAHHAFQGWTWKEHNEGFFLLSIRLAQAIGLSPTSVLQGFRMCFTDSDNQSWILRTVGNGMRGLYREGPEWEFEDTLLRHTVVELFSFAVDLRRHFNEGFTEKFVANVPGGGYDPCLALNTAFLNLCESIEEQMATA